MSKIVVCDVCGERFDEMSVENDAAHIRAELTYRQGGMPDVSIEKDFCVDCADEKMAAFAAAPFVEGLSRTRVAS